MWVCDGDHSLGVLKEGKAHPIGVGTARRPGGGRRSIPSYVDLHLSRVHSIFIDMPQIQIPSPLRQYSGKQASIEVPAKTVGEALAGLVSQHPELKRHLYTEDGKLRAFVNVYVNDEDMRYLQKEATVLNDGDTISIVPSIAGGY